MGGQGSPVRAGEVEAVMSPELVRREGPDRTGRAWCGGAPGGQHGKAFERVVLFSVQQEAK